MTRPRVAVFGALHPEPAARLRERCAVTIVDPATTDHRAALRSALSSADALIGAGLALRARDLQDAPRLRAISSIAAGYDAFDLPALGARGITLMNTPDAVAETTADLAFALMLAAARRVVELAGRVQDGRWSSRIGADDFGVDVHGATLGVVGMGRLGSAITARAAGGFAMDVVYTSRTAKPAVEQAYGARRVALETLLADADFVCLCVALTDDTRDLIGAAELRAMKPDAILVNVARGAVVDEAALAAALRRGQIRAAALDVYRVEPLPTSSPLMGLENVVLVPHVGSATHATRRAMAECAVDNLLGFLDGSPSNVVC